MFPQALTIPNFKIEFPIQEVDPGVFASRTKLFLDDEQIGLVKFYSLSQALSHPYPTLELRFSRESWVLLQGHPEHVQATHPVTKIIQQHWDGTTDENRQELVVRFPVRVV